MVELEAERRAALAKVTHRAMADLPLEFTHSFFQQLLPRARYCLQSTKDAKSRHSADLKELTPSGGMDSNLGPVTSGTLRQAEAHLAQPPAD